MKSLLLKHHPSTKHPMLENKRMDDFVQKLLEMRSTFFTGSAAKGVAASFLVSLRIAKYGIVPVIGEEVLLHTEKDTMACMLGESSTK